MPSSLSSSTIYASDTELTSWASRYANGDIDRLLALFFGFLHRKTDVYVLVPKGHNSKAGFQANEAETKVTKAFRSFPFRDLPVNLAATSSSSSSSNKKSTSSLESTKHSSSSSSVPASSSTHAASSLGNAKPSTGTGHKTAPIANGGAGDGYTWTQTLHDLQIVTKIDSNLHKAKDVQIDFKETCLSLKIGGKILLQGDFPKNEKIKPKDSVWTLEKSSLLIILEKQREAWWPCVVQGEPEIDTSLVDSRKNIHDYDDETQASLRKLIHENSLHG